ncbi:response regulator [Heliobacterium gestii]|uniref:Stage 0 sporulation protein A homolog n=1 Tax=Heliomicrobium gestii TaxID=2699 RepID=A0A845LFA7_HELGE|nr:sigma-54 dependent transcriptional regulator [Heliomicrobium gestii]MBM7865261.1 DNA-binding NtrC family response regulator [Heliomicrobium gestii]MZP41526.1 response regulator [Heliomicrobium gestii]
MQGLLLLLSPEEHLRWVLARGLSRTGYRVIPVENENEAVQQLEREPVILVIVDLDGPGAEGLPVLHRLLGVRANVPVIVLTGQASAETALEAQRLGARDYLHKPFSMDELRVTLEKALEVESLRQEVRFLRLEAAGRRENVELIGASPAMGAIRELIAQVADARTPVLVAGETGTGKEVVARALHHQSRRREYPFVVVPCAAIPPNLIEKELFGWEPTGSSKGGGEGKTQAGRLELAHRGTLLIRHVELLPPDLQVRLCRTLEDGAFTRAGGTKPLAVDVRIIVATTGDLAAAVGDGRLREDLYYRLSVIPIHLPPLSARKEDIADLARHFLCRYDPHGRIRGFTAEAVQRLTAYAWPGNVRELANRIERAVIIARGEWITAAEIDDGDPSATVAAADHASEQRSMTQAIGPLNLLPVMSPATEKGAGKPREESGEKARGKMRDKSREKFGDDAGEKTGETVMVLNQGKELFLYRSPRRRKQADREEERETPERGRARPREGLPSSGSLSVQNDGVTVTIAAPFSLDLLEKKIIESVLKETGGDLAETARVLGLNRPALSARMQKHRISLQPFRSGER